MNAKSIPQFIRILMDAVAVIMDHRVFGLLVWVALAFFTTKAAGGSTDEAILSSLIAMKTYMSGTWEKQSNGKNHGNELPKDAGNVQ